MHFSSLQSGLAGTLGVGEGVTDVAAADGEADTDTNGEVGFADV